MNNQEQDAISEQIQDLKGPKELPNWGHIPYPTIAPKKVLGAMHPFQGQLQQALESWNMDLGRFKLVFLLL